MPDAGGSHDQTYDNIENPQDGIPEVFLPIVEQA